MRYIFIKINAHPYGLIGGWAITFPDAFFSHAFYGLWEYIAEPATIIIYTHTYRVMLVFARIERDAVSTAIIAVVIPPGYIMISSADSLPFQLKKKNVFSVLIPSAYRCVCARAHQIKHRAVSVALTIQ